jgi:hypothetical protein
MLRGGTTVRRILTQTALGILPAILLIAVVSVNGAAQARPSMELLETKQSATQTTIEIVGRVKNISPREVSGVNVICDFQDANGKSIRREQTHLETDPLGPNKISQFKVSTPYNAAIQRFHISFAEMFGGPLVTKDSRK